MTKAEKKTEKPTDEELENGEPLSIMVECRNGHWRTTRDYYIVKHKNGPMTAHVMRIDHCYKCLEEKLERKGLLKEGLK